MDALFDRAIVLEKRSLGEDAIEALFLSETRGKFWGKAPAVARSRKRFPAGIEYFTLFETELGQTARQKKSGWMSVKMARPLVRYTLTRDMAHYSIAARMTELINRLMPAGVGEESAIDTAESRALFNLLITSYATLEAAPPEKTDIVQVWFEWRLLVLLGYAIDPFRCTACDKKFGEDTPARWCAGAQSITCADCTGNEADTCKTLSFPALQLAQKLSHTPVPGGFSQKATMPATTVTAVDEIKALLENQIKLLLTRPLKSDDFMKTGG